MPKCRCNDPSARRGVLASTGRRIASFIFGLLIFAGWSATGSAQSQFDVWNTDQGLPQNSIQDILQDRAGYLWFTTSDGLVRFDGAAFTVFNHGNSPGLNSNRLSVLFEDRDGVLWIGTEDSGLVKFQDGVFTAYAVKDGLPANWILQLQEDPAPGGHLLVRTSTGIVRWPDKVWLKRGESDRDPAAQIRYVDQEGAVWFYDGLALHRIKDDDDTVYTSRDGLLGSRITSLYRDREGSLWIATSDAGLQRLKDGKFRNYPKADGLPESIRTFFEDREGNLWIGTTDGGLARLSYGHDDARYDALPTDQRIHRYTTANGLSSNAIKVIYEDTEGSIWIGTVANGLNRLREQIVTDLSRHDGLGGDNVYPIYQDQAGQVWMGTWPRGVTVYQDGHFKRYTKEDGLLAGDLITAFAEDRDGQLWIGGYGGICWFAAGEFHAVPASLTLKGGGLAAILQDGAGSYWFGTDAAGLYRYREGALSRFTMENGLPSDSIRAIVEDGAGGLWLGTYGGLVHVQDEKFTVYSTKDGLASDRVRSLYKDSAGTLWIGTFDGGLSRYKDGRFTTYTTGNGLFNNGVFQILEDDHEDFWLSCNLGVYRVSKREMNDFADGKIPAITSIAYGKADGMLDVECNGGAQPSGTRTQDGKLWFPTQAGVAIFDPNAIRINAKPPPVVIESALVDREFKDLRQPLRIEPGQINLEIHYTGLSFVKPEQVKFKYKLEGVDRDWVDVGNRRVAYYSHLAPGEYVFRVIAANSDGVWNLEGALIKITIRPPFYETSWFLVLAVGLLLGAAVGFYRWRLTRWEKENVAQQAFSRQLLESQELERKRIAAELHDGLGQSLVVIKNRALVGLNAPANHDRLLAQMEEISAATTAAIAEVRGIARNLHPYQIDYLGLTTALKTMIESLASVSRIEYISDIDPVEGLLSQEDEINLYRIVQEGLNNVEKHSGAAGVTVALNATGQVLDLVIADDGIGFTPGEEGRNHGLGLIGMVERARLIGANYELRSAPGKGTTVHLRMSSRRAKDES